MMAYLITKDNKYLSANGKFTSNINFAYVYDSKEEADKIAKSYNAQVINR